MVRFMFPNWGRWLPPSGMDGGLFIASIWTEGFQRDPRDLVGRPFPFPARERRRLAPVAAEAEQLHVGGVLDGAARRHLHDVVELVARMRVGADVAETAH